MRKESPFQGEKKALFKELRDVSFFQFEPNIHHQQNIPFATYAPWAADETFLALFSIIKNNTLVDIYRCFELWDLVRNMDSVEGDILEVGVWRGGTGGVLCKAAEGSASTVYLADTFAGVVKASEEDKVYRGGEHSDTSVEIVTELMQAIDANNYQILKGIFPDDFPEVSIEKLKLCHIDVDTFQSAKDVFEYAWPKIQVGGIVIFDDYGFWTCEGVTNYFNSLNLSNGRKLFNLNGHGILIKFAMD